jgi:hypothetical protein
MSLSKSGLSVMHTCSHASLEVLEAVSTPLCSYILGSVPEEDVSCGNKTSIEHGGVDRRFQLPPDARFLTTLGMSRSARSFLASYRSL